MSQIRWFVLAISALATQVLASEYCDSFARQATPYASSPVSTGRAADPHMICTLAQLDNVRLEPESHFRQMADIEASDTHHHFGNNSWNSRFGFIPLFSASGPFSGVYDGNGYFINRLKINGPGQSDRSLFGVASSAIIKGVHLKGVLVFGGKDTAGLVSRVSYDGEQRPAILESSVKGHLIASSQDMNYGAVGGVVATLGAGAIAEGLKFAGTITVQQTAGNNRGVGGIVGYADTLAQINRCRSRATITAIHPEIGFILGVGGVVGTLGNLARVERCHAFKPEILVDALVLGAGGLVGRSDGKSISNASSRKGFVHASAEGNGGFMGYGYQTHVSRSWTSTIVSGDGFNGGFVGTTDGGGLSFTDSFASGIVTGIYSGGFIGAILYTQTTTFNRVYASGDTDEGAGFLGLLEFNQGEGNHVTVLSSFSSGASVRFIDGLYDKEAHFLNNNYWYNPLDPNGTECEECNREHDISALQQPKHPVYSGHGGAATAWNFKNVWKARSGRLPTLRLPPAKDQ